MDIATHKAEEISCRDWADDLGMLWIADDEHGDQVQYPHPICERGEIDGPRPDDIPESVWEDGTAYYRAAIEAVEAWQDAARRAIELVHGGDAASAREAIEEARRIEAEYGDDPDTRALADALGLDRRSDAKEVDQDA